LKEKNVKMADDLLGLRHSYAHLNREYEEKTKAYEGLIQKQRANNEGTRAEHGMRTLKETSKKS